MPYPTNLGRVLEAAGYEPALDFLAFEDAGVLSIYSWDHTDPQPTEQQINDWANDITNLPSGQLFSEWQAEHGGNETTTAKRIAKEMLTADTPQARFNKALLRLLKTHVTDLQGFTDQQIFNALVTQIENDL